MDISNLGQPLLQGGLLDTITRFVGGSPESTRKTLSASLPTTMYAIADHGSSELGARGLLEGLRSGQAPQMDISNLERTLSDPQASDKLLASSGGFLEKMLGGKLAGILGGLSSFGGSSPGVTSKLIALAAPRARGGIGRHARAENLDGKGLASFLGQQKGRVASLVPGPLRQSLGLAQTEATVEPVRAEAPVVRREVARPRIEHAPVVHEHPSRWPWILAGLAALFGVGWLLTRASSRPHVAEVTAPTLEAPRAAPVEAQPPAAPPEVQRPAVTETAPALAAGPLKPIADYLASGQSAPRRFVVEGLTFATGQSALTTDGEKSATDLAGILRAHPDATIRVEGFTDSTGSAAVNQRLSQARSEEVKRALSADGIDGSRIATSGLGDDKPLGSNDSSSGRGENRRVEVVVSPKG